jgi:hypothetical protein
MEQLRFRPLRSGSFQGLLQQDGRIPFFSGAAVDGDYIHKAVSLSIDLSQPGLSIAGKKIPYHFPHTVVLS